jgi:hypothetical protein
MFKDQVNKVIDTLEGGYFHPNMLLDGRVKDARYSNSGETMFGIDRLKGGSINSTAAGKRFWMLIDQANAKNNWKWNYKGGILEPELKSLAAEMIQPLYNTLSKNYLTQKAIDIVNNNALLLFHFIYATYNGSGWFKKFANDITTAIASGITDPMQLAQIAINSRTKEGLTKGSKPNSLIVQSGNKIASMFNVISPAIKIATPLIIAGLILYFILKK